MVKAKNNTEESEDESNKGEIRYNGQIISSMLVKEIKAALEKLGVPVKRTDRKAQCEELLREALKNHAHHNTTSPASSRRKGANNVLRSKSSPPVSGRSLRSAGYGLRSRDNSSKRGKASGDAGTSHIKASVATGESGTYEDHDMIFYSVKGNMPVSSPSATSQRSRSRPSRSSRSTRTNTAVSDEDKSQGEDEESEEEKGATVVKKRKPSPRKSRSVASPKQTKTGRNSRKQERKVKEEVVEDSEDNNEEQEGEEEAPTPVKSTSKSSTKSPSTSTAKASPVSVPASTKKKAESRRSSHSSQHHEVSTSTKKFRLSSSKQRQLDELAMFTAAVENAADEMESMDEEEKELYETLRHGEGSDNEEEEEDESGEDSEGEGALNDSGNFFDAEYGQDDDEIGSASEGEGHSESGDSSDDGTSEGEERDEDDMVIIGEDEDGEEGDSEEEGDEESMEMIEVEEEDGDSEDGEGVEEEENSEEGESEEENEDGSDEDDSEEEDDDEFAFKEPGLPEVVDLMSDSEEGEEEEPYVAPAFPTFSFTAPTPNSKSDTMSFGSNMAGANTTTSTTVPTFTFSMGSNGPQISSSITANPFAPNPFAAPAKPFDSVKPALSKQPTKEPFNPFAAIEGKLSAPIKPLPPFGVKFNPNPVPTVTQETVQDTPVANVTVAQATTPAASTAPPALSDLSPAALAFSKLSNSFISVFANNLTSTKKEKLSVEEYSLLKSLLESSKPAEIEAAEKAASAITTTTVNDTVKKAVQVLDHTNNTDITEIDKTIENNQEEKENKATKTISFSTRGDASIPRPRTSYDGSWNSRESFLPSPSPSGSPVAAKATTGVDSVASKITFDVPANERLARRLPTPYHPTKRTAFSAGWTGGSEVSMLGEEQQEEDAFSLLPPSKRQSLEGYRSIQFRQQTPGPSHYGHNRLSVGSGILEDTPASSWTGGSVVRSTVRNSLSGYPPSGLPQSSHGMLGRPGHTPMFRGNAIGYTPSTAQSAASADSRISCLPVSTAGRYSIGGPPPNGHAGVTGIAPSSLSYIQRRKLQLKSDNTASAAVAKKILETLGGLSTPLEEQRKKPLAIKWQDEEEAAKPAASMTSKSNGSTPMTTVATPASAPRVTFGEVKVAQSPSSSSAIKSPASSTEVKKATIPSTADLSSPYLHSSIRKPTEQQIEQRQERRIVAAQIAADRAASVGDDEFTFEEPTVVNGIEEHMIEEVDRASGQTKRRLSMPVDQSVKYIFTPPNKSKKSTETASISASKSAATTNTATPAVNIEKKIDSAPSVNIWAASSINDGVKCNVCMVRNKKDAVKCASCESPLTAASSTTSNSTTAKKDSPSTTTAPASSGLGIWAAASINSGIKCDACMVRNKEGATKCASCEAPLKSTASTAAPVATTTSSSASAFGAPAKAADVPGAIGKGGFTFGASATANSTTTSANGSGPAFGGFGGNTSASATEVKPSAGGFAFPGAAPVTTEKPAAATTPTAGGFSFPGAAPVTTEKPAAATTPAASGFTFGATSTNSSTTTTASTVTTTASTAPATSNPFGGFSFNTAKPSSTETSSEVNKPSTATTAPTSLPSFTTPSFGTKPATSTTIETVNVKRSAEAERAISGREESEDQPSSKKRAGGFGGGESSTAPAPAPAFEGFSGFGSNSGSSTAPPASSTSFGGFPALPAGVDLGNSSGGEKPKPVVTFGGFGATAPVTGTTSTTKASEGFTFGTVKAGSEEKKAETPAAITFDATPSTVDSKSDDPKPFTFGSVASAGSDKKAEEPKPSFSFGASSSTAAPAVASTEPKPFMFGGPSASTEVKPFMFGASAPAASSTTPAPASSTGLPTLPAFQFGATTTTTSGEQKDQPFSFAGAPASTSTALTGFTPARSTSGTSLPALATTFTAGKPPLASSSNSIGGASTTNAFGVAAVDSSTATTFPPASTSMSFGSGSMNTASPGMDVGSAGSSTGTGNPFSSSAFPAAPAPAAAGPFGSTPSFGTAAAPAANPFSSSFGVTTGAPSAAPASSLGNTGFAFGSNNNLAAGSNVSPTFGASPFATGAPVPAAGNPFGGPQQSSGFGAPTGAPFGGAPAVGSFSMPNSGSSGNLYGAGAPGGGQQNAMGGFNATAGAAFGAGAFGGSSNNLNAMGGPLSGAGNPMGMGGFGGAPSAAPAGGGGGFSLGAADKTTAPRRKVVVPKRK